MARGRTPKPTPDSSVTEAALAAMDAQELRDLISDIIPWLDEATHTRMVNALVDRAARNRSGWVPAAPTNQVVADIVTFAAAARRVGYAQPSQIDEYLRLGSNAFLGKDYRAALQIFHALLIPIGDVDIDLGQHEMVEEVLGVDVQACSAQHVVSAYMTATEQNRGQAVLSAIDEMSGTGCFWEPLREMERVAVEPLPEFDSFLAQWRALVEVRSARERNSDWGSGEGRWLREVVARMEGADGLARVARASKRAVDLLAWCSALVELKEWRAALSAFDEAAELVDDEAYAVGVFLDGAALAAQELGRRDLPKRLERAWRQAPTIVRLRRWLGSSRTKKALRQRAVDALPACPKKARRQRALLHLLLGDLAAAAELLAGAPGLGWSDGDHPGHLLFPLFCSLLGGVELSTEVDDDFDEFDLMSAGDEQGLDTPEVAVLVHLAGVAAPTDNRTRTAVLKAMRKAAEKRIEGVIEHKRRRHYGHAASLAFLCAQVDATPEAAAWLGAIRDRYRRYPALQRELARVGGRPTD